MDEQTLIETVAVIINDHPDRVKWDIPKSILIEELVKAYVDLEAYAIANPPIEVIKEKNGIPTVIQTMDNRYTLQHPNHYKGGNNMHLVYEISSIIYEWKFGK